jgi:DNA (cytosine-5)-methyltransferase 1
MASNQLLVRDVPPQIRAWIRSESSQRGHSINEFVLSLLRSAHDPAAGQGDLFSTTATEQASLGNAIPFGFIDLFAGIGGLRLGLEAVGGKCLFSSEWDEYCKRTYYHWFKESPAGDITKQDVSKIPDHDVLAAGFPCQPFSIAGVSKKNSLGRAHGFKDATQGNLFFTLANIIELKRPPVIILENVKNLRSHDGGRTWEVISRKLEKLEYKIFAEVMDAAGWVPQHRERIFIVGFDKRVFGEAPPFRFPEPPKDAKPKIASILEPNPDPKYTLSDHLWKYLQDYAKKHKEKGNGFGFGLVDLDGVSRTLSARYFKDGSEILIPQEGQNPRRLTPRECARLMGFPDELPIPVSDTQAYKQFGNAVVPPVAEAVAGRVVEILQWFILTKKKGCLVGPRRRINGNGGRRT